MSEIDKIAKKQGVRFRHFRDKNGELVATIATVFDPKFDKLLVSCAYCRKAPKLYKDAISMIKRLKGANILIPQDADGLVKHLKEKAKADIPSKEKGKQVAFNRLMVALGGAWGKMLCHMTQDQLEYALKNKSLLDYFNVPRVEIR